MAEGEMQQGWSVPAAEDKSTCAFQQLVAEDIQTALEGLTADRAQPTPLQTHLWQRPGRRCFRHIARRYRLPLQRRHVASAGSLPAALQRGSGRWYGTLQRDSQDTQLLLQHRQHGKTGGGIGSVK